MRASLLVAVALVVVAGLAPRVGRAFPISASIGGFVQPQFRWVTADPTLMRDDVGFVLHAVRPFLSAVAETGSVEFFLRMEADVTPQFSLFDGYLGVRGPLPGHGDWSLRAGQMTAPFSRQMLVWPTNLQMINRAMLVDLAPQQQLGGTLEVRVPYARWINLSLGLYNGEGRNVIQNVDKSFMFVGRLAIRPLNPTGRLVESGFGDTTLSVASNFATNKLDQGGFTQTLILLGGDIFFSWKGLSFYGEFVFGKTTYSASAAKPNFQSFGINAQLGYLLPIPGWLYQRFEVAARFEEVLRNDTVPLAAVGDPNQDTQKIAAALNFYSARHAAKVQLNYIHTIYRADPGRMGQGFANETLLVQTSFRLEN